MQHRNGFNGYICTLPLDEGTKLLFAPKKTEDKIKIGEYPYGKTC
jgi:hypothetical protein